MPSRGSYRWSSQSRRVSSFSSRFSRVRRNSTPRATSAIRPSQSSSTPVPTRPRDQVSGSQNRASAATHAPTEQTSRRDDEEDIDPDADALNEIVMAVDLRDRGTVGCVYYVARDEKLYFMEDVKLGGIDTIEALRLHIEPTVIIVQTKVDDDVIDRLDPESRLRNSSVIESYDQFRLPYMLEVRPSAEFYYEAGKNKLVNLRLDSEDGPTIKFTIPNDVLGADAYDTNGKYTGRQEDLLRLAGWIDVESRITVGCAGALISYLQRRRASDYLPGDDAAYSFFRISTIEMFSLKGFMFINAETLQSLQIVQTESHPNYHNQGPKSSGAKEGLSVYGLFHRLARTPQGKLRLRQYFLRPSMSMQVINERLNAVAVFFRPDNNTQLHDLMGELRNIKDMRKVVMNLQKGVTASQGPFNQSSWLSLYKFVGAALSVRDLVHNVNGADRLPLRNKAVFEARNLAHIGTEIRTTVDMDMSETERRIVVNPNVSDELDEMKRKWDGLEPMLKEVTRALEPRVPLSFRAWLNVIYFPQIGFILVVWRDDDTESGTYQSQGLELEGWEQIFTTVEAMYYKSAEMRELDEKFGDMWTEICEKEIEIVHELAQRVLERKDLLTAVSELCGELDCILALAQGAIQYRLTKPHISRDNVINIEGGRHILQELTIGSFVPNDTFLVGGIGPGEPEENQTDPSTYPTSQSPSDSTSEDLQRPSMLIMTGPNFSGKSVYLKQVAVMVYMAHVGCFVPAERARIGITDKILTRISTSESVSRVQSAFMINIQQISLALSLATNRSLLIIDEFGKGTEADDGAGLACGMLEYLLGLGYGNPKVVAATHFHEIFESGFLRPRPSLAFGYMEVRVDRDSLDAGKQITYLYNLRNGRSMSSYGTTCAEMNGIAPEVVERAEELLVLTARGKDLVTACSVMPKAEAIELEEAEQIARDFLAADILSDPRQILDEILSITGTKESENNPTTQMESMSVVTTTVT